jgi:DNA-binding response OmpR family regulator
MDPNDEPDALSPGTPHQPASVLMIDDDQKLCRLVARYCRGYGLGFVASHTGSDGLASALCPQRRWSAVVLDMMLPEMPGMEVLRRIRLSSNIPIIVFTACGEASVRDQALVQGATDFLTKTESARLVAGLRIFR